MFFVIFVMGKGKVIRCDCEAHIYTFVEALLISTSPIPLSDITETSHMILNKY